MLDRFPCRGAHPPAGVMPDEIRADLRDFIVNEIGSIAELELLLLLYREPQKVWSAQEAAKALYTAEDATAAQLESFRARGYAAIDAEGTYSFTARSPDQHQLIADLAQLYQTRRVTVINLIYAGPVQKMKSFADAFRLRKPKPEED
jgi:hypothetical protein